MQVQLASNINNLCMFEDVLRCVVNNYGGENQGNNLLHLMMSKPRTILGSQELTPPFLVSWAYTRVCRKLLVCAYRRSQRPRVEYHDTETKLYVEVICGSKQDIAQSKG